jgi:DNA helicase II / ATP-dependent DNA helicase PcrA
MEKKELHKELTQDQLNAVMHIESHACLIAGPGTGKTKTITHRILELIINRGIKPDQILILSFTRFAAQQLRFELKLSLDKYKLGLPDVSTIHSFALKQIINNSKNITSLPQPVRIADDWEERNIIIEDLKVMLNLKSVKEVKTKIHELSANWENLNPEKKDINADPKFIGAWAEHRKIYGETLRAEIVYQLNMQLHENRMFRLNKKYLHLIIDEFQDLNPCDLSIIKKLALDGTEIFAAGDDDQSIYGFRYADPSCIRSFQNFLPNSRIFKLETCYRCDTKIFEVSDFVAGLDYKRIIKPTKPRKDSLDGEVVLMSFENQFTEAEKIALMIDQLQNEQYKLEEIVILLRNDRNGVMSRPIRDSLEKRNIKISSSDDGLLKITKYYRNTISLLRLVANIEDSLAWRTLLKEKKGIGPQCIQSIFELAESEGITFSTALRSICTKNKSEINNFKLLKEYFDRIKIFVEEILKEPLLKRKLVVAIEKCTENEDEKNILSEHFTKINDTFIVSDLNDFLQAMSLSSDKIEQDLQPNSLRILTMHQAKGLTCDVCFVVGAEDEIIPGRNIGDKLGDERRLLYVSMSRARHKLYITYCSTRTGAQSHYGKNCGTPYRNLSQFLVHLPCKKTAC